MEAKQMLKEYRGLKLKIKLLEDEIMAFESRAEGTSLQMDGQPKAQGQSDRLALYSVKAADAMKDQKELVEELNQRRWEIVRLVTQIKDSTQVKVIHGRYIADQEASWPDLAGELGLTSVRQVQRIHGEALEELQDVIEREELGR